MENDLETNAKNMSPVEQYQARKSIVRLLKSGVKPDDAARALGVSRSMVYAAKKAYDEKGIEGIKPQKRGRRPGDKKKLTPEQEWEIIHILVDKTPDQLKFKDCMWSRENVGELIMQKFGIKMPLSTMALYLQRWGFTVQRPAKRAYKQDEEQVKKWVESEFPGISARAEKEHADIYFGDETGMQNLPNLLRGYSPKGKTPIVRVESKRLKINMLSAISCRGKLRFMLYKDNMDSDKLIDFMRRLVRDTPRKVFLILDNLRVHHSKKVADWLEKHVDQIELFFLPPYAPEFNPDELLNADLKRGLSKLCSPRSLDELEHNVRAHLQKLRFIPAKIASFFHSPTTSYAACAF